MKIDAAMPFVVAGRVDWARNTSSDLLHDQVAPFSSLANCSNAKDT